MAGECDMTFDDCTAVCGSYFAHIHCVMGMPSEVGTLTVRNSAVNSVKDAVSIRSQNAIVNIESSDIVADNGVLVHSIVNTDPNATKTGRQAGLRHPCPHPGFRAGGRDSPRGSRP